MLSSGKFRTKDLVDQILIQFNTLNASLLDIRTCFIFAVGFAGAHRSNEIIRIVRKNVVISEKHFTIFFDKRKNDQYKLGHTVFISKSDCECVCPLSITKKVVKDDSG